MDVVTPTSKGKPNPDFEIRLVGPGVKPWRVPMRALTRTLNAVQRLMEPAGEDRPEDEREQKEEPATSDVPLHLIKIISGSARYGVSANDPARTIKTLTETGLALKDPNAQEWDLDLLSPIESLSDVARSLGCSIEFKEYSRDGEIFATVDGNSYSTLAATAFVMGESSVYGYLERVGGATDQRCGLRLPNQPSRMIYCTVKTEDLVRQLGQHIYENVLVSGTVTWLRKAWRVKSVFVKDFEPSKTGSILETLDQIYEAGAKAWDDIDDPGSLIAEMRGE